MLTVEPPRLAVIDGLRGVAVLGIVLMNIADFALPQFAYLQPLLGGRSPADIAVWAIELILVDGKFRNLFSLLFGASMLLVADRAEAAGRSGAGLHYTRMGWLLPFGLAHLYLLWWGDILHHYAIVGSIAFLFRRRPPHTLFALAIVILALDTLLLSSTGAGLWSLRSAALASGATPGAIAAWANTSAALHPIPAAISMQDLTLHGGTYAGLVRDRVGAQGWLPIDELVTAGPETFALMLMGMAALRSGFLRGAWPRATYRRIAIGCYAVGLPVMAGLAIWCVVARFDPLVCFWAALALSLPVRAPLMFGHAALLILWFTGGDGAMRDRLRAAGRMAFTNYLLTSLLLTTLFYGYGGGLYGRMGRAALLAPVAGMWVLMLVWSRSWLRRYRYGPMEWVWRSLVRWRPEPMRRTDAHAIARRLQ